MNIEELRAAIERLRDRESIHTQQADTFCVALDLTNPEPLSIEVLVERFDWRETEGFCTFKLNDELFLQWSPGGGVEIYVTEDDEERYEAFPDPETVGDLTFLLYRLTRTPTGG